MSIKKTIDIAIDIQQQGLTIQQLEYQMESLNKDTKEYINLNKQLQIEQKKLAASTKALATNTEDYSKSATKVKDKSKSVNQAVVELGRGISDLPYGIQGVANNFGQLTEIFTRVEKDAGGTAKGIKSIASAMFGPLGILIGIQTLLSLAQTDWFKNLIAGAGKATETVEGLTKAITEFYSSSVSNIYRYLDLLDDANISEEQRLDITKELIEEVPTLTEADFEYGKTLDSVKDKVDAYVLAQAGRIEADKLVEANSEKLALLARIRSIEAIEDEEKRLEAIKRLIEDAGGSLTQSLSTDRFISGGAVGASSASASRKKTAEELVSDTQDLKRFLEAQLKPVNDTIDELLLSSFGLGGDGDGGKSYQKKLQELTDGEAQELQDRAFNLQQQLDAENAYYDKSLEFYDQYLQDMDGLGTQEVEDEDKRLEDLEKFLVKFYDARAKQADSSGVLLAEKQRDRQLKEAEELGASEEILHDIVKFWRDKIDVLKQKSADKQKEIDKAESERIKELEKERMEAAIGGFQVASDVASALSGLAKEGSKEAKNLAIAAAVLDTIASGIAAYKSVVGIPGVGPVLAPIAAATAVAAGIASINKMKAVDETGEGEASVPRGVAAPSAGINPRYSVIGTTTASRADTSETNSLLQAASETPLKTYITAKDVETAAALEREIENNSSI